MYFIPIKNEYVLPEKFIYLISIPIKVLSIRENQRSDNNHLL